MLLGTSFSFVHFLDWCEQSGVAFRLPEKSRLMDTGGFKGRSREVPRDELYRAYEKTFGIPPEWRRRCALPLGWLAGAFATSLG
jgi:hypothetical protein